MASSSSSENDVPCEGIEFRLEIRQKKKKHKSLSLVECWFFTININRRWTKLLDTITKALVYGTCSSSIHFTYVPAPQNENKKYPPLFILYSSSIYAHCEHFVENSFCLFLVRCKTKNCHLMNYASYGCALSLGIAASSHPIHRFRDPFVYDHNLNRSAGDLARSILGKPTTALTITNERETSRMIGIFHRCCRELATYRIQSVSDG